MFVYVCFLMLLEVYNFVILASCFDGLSMFFLPGMSHAARTILAGVSIVVHCLNKPPFCCPNQAEILKPICEVRRNLYLLLL